MTPIEQMAKEHGKASNTVMRYNGMSQQMLLDGYNFTKLELEALREAIIKDFVNGLEPDCYVSEGYKSLISLGHKIIASRTEYKRFNTPLFDLRQWRNK